MDARTRIGYALHVNKQIHTLPTLSRRAQAIGWLIPVIAVVLAICFSG
jgi:hypothetical protein